MFCIDSPDEQAAKDKLHKDAEADDMKIEILGLEFKEEVELDIPIYQKPTCQK